MSNSRAKGLIKVPKPDVVPCGEAEGVSDRTDSCSVAAGS